MTRQIFQVNGVSNNPLILRNEVNQPGGVILKWQGHTGTDIGSLSTTGVDVTSSTGANGSLSLALFSNHPVFALKKDVANDQAEILMGSSKLGALVGIGGPFLAFGGGSALADSFIYRAGSRELSTNSDFEITDTDKGVILTSPNNTKYRLKVANDGTLSTEAA